MKKIVNFIMIVGTMGFIFSACTLDKYPVGSLSTDESFSTVLDATKYRNGFYTALRGVHFNVFSYVSELQSDLYNATTGYGNRFGGGHRMEIEMLSDYDVRDIWMNTYTQIAQINNFLDKIGGIAPSTDEEANLVKQYIAEAHYTRAYLYYVLVKHYGADYDPATAGSKLGLPLCTTYDVTEKPERSSLEATYQFIKGELDLAIESGNLTSVSAASERISLEAAKALKSKIQLLMHDNTGAAATAQELIAKFPLITTAEALKAYWAEDKNNEDIFLLNVSSAQNGIAYLGADLTNPQVLNNGMFGSYTVSNKTYGPDYIPTKTLVDMFETNDFRRTCYLSDPEKDTFAYNAIKYPGIQVLLKWPMTSIYTTNSYLHKPKVARIAEQYLIAAEALGTGGGLAILNQLRTARGASTVDAGAFEQTLRDEWAREMCGEGVRIECLKRWNIGYDSRPPQNELLIMGGAADVAAMFARKYAPAGYYRFILPIPMNDLQANPSLMQTPEWVNPQ